MFDASQREIFRYHDGVSEKFGDPLAIDDRYLDAIAGEDQEALDEQLASEIGEVSRAASRRMYEVVRRTFRLPPFDEDTGAGLTIAEAMDLFNRYWDWKDAIKKNGGGPPSTPPSSGGSPGSP